MRSVLAKHHELGLRASALATILGCGGIDATDLRGGEADAPQASVSLAAVRPPDDGAALELSPPSLDWQPCADGFECTTARVPLDYTRPRGTRLALAVTRLAARDPARRIGPLFVNFGGPGGGAVDALHQFGAAFFATLNERFDIIGFDPRGTGQTEGAIDCHVDQELEGLYAIPFTTPQNFDVEAWYSRADRYVQACLAENGAAAFEHVSTADAARDMDSLRAALGERELSYLGFSYGSFLGATYVSLFPRHYRAVVLDGALDADQYINRPSEGLRAQAAGLERALSRFLEACAAAPSACDGFGGVEPRLAFDQLVSAANEHPLAVPNGDRLVDGDAIISATSSLLYAKQAWPLLAQALAEAEGGDATLLRGVADAVFGLRDDGSFEPATDRYFALGAAEQRYDNDPIEYQDAGYASWATFEHFFSNTGYSELPYGLFQGHQSAGAYYGPFIANPSAPTVLVVATLYDPATPYRGSERLVEQLGNARLLTMIGDGHTAYGGNSRCIDAAIEDYLTLGALPSPGAECTQEVPFEPLSMAMGEMGDGASAAAAASGQLATRSLPLGSRARGVLERVGRRPQGERGAPH